MNAQFQVAQLAGSTLANSSTPPRIFKLAKPMGDQAVVVNLGYDQKVKVDFSAISNEKITLVHVGEKLIILFDNKSTVTIEPFFDSMHDEAKGLTIEVAPGRDVSVSEFASLFPITTDQSVLPAAGEGGNAQASGANFSNSSVDPLATGNPLDLLGQESLGTFALTPETFNGTPNIAPSGSFTLSGVLTVHDETLGVQPTADDQQNTALPAVFQKAGLIGWAQSDVPEIASATVNFGTNGPGTVAYLLTTSAGAAFAGVDSGLKATATGNEIFLFTEGNLIVAREGSGGNPDAGGAIAFALYLDPVSLKLSVAQYEAVQHGNALDSNDQIELAHVVFVQQVVTDKLGVVVTQVSSDSIGVAFDDDGPAISVSVAEPEEGSTRLATLTLDESTGNDPNPAGFPNGTADDTGSSTPDPTGTTPIGEVKTAVGGGEGEQGQGALQALFNVVKDPGTDGEKSTTYQYSFSLTGGSGPSGSVASTLKVTDPNGLYGNDTIYLFKVSDTEIVGHVGNDPNGPIALRITLVNAGSLSGGQLVVDQYMAIDHGQDGNNFDSSKALTLLSFNQGEGGVVFASLGITLTATITDVDNDTAKSSATVEIAGGETSSIRFQDDGPVLIGEGSVIGTVDEDGLAVHNADAGRTGELAGTGSAVATGSLASLVDFGTDGPAASGFKVAVQDTPVDSGLTSQGAHVLIVSDGTTLHGYVETGVAGSGFSDGDREVFTLTVGADGSYTFTLKDQIDHPTLNNAEGDNGENILTSLDLSAFIVATDGDGDHVNLGEGTFKIEIQDDIPVLTGASISRTVDEDDIRTPWSQGTSPNDGSADGSTTEDSTGAAIVSGTLAGVVSVGADEAGTFGFSSDAIAKLTALGLYSKQSAQGDGENGKLLTYEISNGSVGSHEVIITGYEPNPNGNPVFSLTLNTETGAYEFRLYDELIHTQGSGQNSDLRSGPLDDGVQHSIPNIDLGSIITFTDKDGDTITLTGKFTINVTDDVPHADIDLGWGSVTVDETPGNQADDTTSSSVRNLFASLEATFVSGVRLVGDDPDVSGDNNGGNSGNGAIAYARSDFAVVIDDSVIGADYPPYPHTFSLSVAGGNGTDSGLFVTDGGKIVLSVNADGLILGTVSDANSAFNGKVAFAIAIDSDGKVSVAQYLSIKHDDRGDSNETNDNGTNFNDASPDDPQTIQQTLDGKIIATLTVTDSDGDKSSDSVNIGRLINFLDDGPSVEVHAVSGFSVVHDETPGVQSSDDDTMAQAVRDLFANVHDKGSDPHLTSGQKVDGAIGFAQSEGAALTVSTNFGADGAATVNSKVFSLTLNGGNGTSSGLETTDGKNIYLFKEGDLIVGRYDGPDFGSGTTNTGSDPAAFAIAIDPVTGKVSVVQYVSLQHGDQNSTDEFVAIAGNKVFATVTVTDGDGDSARDSADISGKVRFEDDGPTVTTAKISVAVDEDGLSTGNLDAGRPGETTGTGSAVAAGAAGALNALVNFGADGAASTAFHLAVQSSPVNSGLESKGGDIFIVSDGTTLRGYVDQGGNSGYQAGTDREVFTLTVGANGSYVFTLKDQIDHAGDNTENLLTTALDLSNYIIATDGDGDTVRLASGAFTIQVRDDIPVTAPSTQVRVDEDDLPAGNHDTTSAGDDIASASPVTGTLNFSVGADEPASVDFASLNGTAVLNTSGQAVKAGGAALAYLWDASTNTLYATSDGTTANAAFKIQITDTATGAYSFSLLGKLDHPGHDSDGQNNGPDTAYEDNINIDLTYTVSDRDGDKATGTLSVSIDDDIAVAKADTDTVSSTVQTLNFDDIALGDTGETPITSSYHGFNFSQTGVYNPPGSGPYPTYAPHSGSNLAFIGEKDGVEREGYSGTAGDPITITHTDGSKFTALGAWFSANGSDPLTITVYGYVDGVQVSSFSQDIHQGASGGPTYVNLSVLGNVDKIVVNAPGYFGFDDFSYADNSTATGNVITGTGTTSAGADMLGADGAKVTGVVGVTADTTPDGSHNFAVTGQHGTLVINENGGYTYIRFDGSPIVANDVFTYTLTDGDGDVSTATLTIEISDHGVTIAGINSEGGDINVFENDLLASRGAGESAGTSPDAASLTQSGTFAVSAADGLNSLIIDGHAIVTNGVFTATSFTTATGNIFAVTAFDGTTVSYSYTLVDNEQHASVQGNNSLPENLSVVATDSDGESATSTIKINIVDDVPTAAAGPAMTVVETDGVTSGANLLLNDTQGADGATVTAVDIGNGFQAIAASGATTLSNANGTYTFQADGTWTFDPNANLNNASGISADFTYQITDGDGDISTAMQTVTINDGAVAATPATITLELNEAALSTAGATGSNAGLASEVDGTPSLSFTAGSDNLTSFAFTSTSGLVTDLNGTGGQDIFWQLVSGTQIKGFLDAGHTQLAVTLDLSAPASIAAGATGNVTVTATLSDNLQHVLANGAQIASIGSVGVVATDTDGDLTTGTVNITVQDDVPTAVNDTWATTITGATVLTGLLSNDKFGADGVDTDNSPVTGQVTVTNGTHGTVVYNNDGTFTYTPTAGYSGGDSFTYTIKDGDGDTSTATVTLSSVQNNSSPTAGSTSASVDDEGLPNGIAGSTFNDDLAGQATTVSGTLPHNYNTDGKAASDPINFAPMDGTTGQVGTESVTYSWNAANNTLTASSAARGAIFTVVVDGGSDNGNGNYVFTLLKPVLHNAGNNENDATVNLTYQVKDANADKVTGTLAVTIDDDMPVAAPIVKTVTEGSSDTNILLILDRSGSMDFDPEVSGYATRLDLLKAAASELLDQYDAAGEVRVQIIKFNDSAQKQGSVWLSVADAKAYINGLTANDGTDFDDATALAPDAFDDAGKLTTSGVRNVSYFISDGQPDPTSGQVSGDELTDWINFVNANKIVSYAIGLGSEAPSTYLDPLAYDGTGSGTDTDALIVTNLNQLQSTLAGTINPSISGSVIDGSIPTSFGADGGYVKSIEIGGKTYTYNPVTDAITTTGSGSNSGAFNAAANKLTITFSGSAGESFVIDLDDGSYVYTPPTSITADFSRPFTYTLTDNDGDTATATLTVNIDNVNGAPVLDAADSPVIAAVNEDAPAPSGAVGTLVSALVDKAGGGGFDNVTDADGPGLGVAITGTNSANGTWYYSTNNGATWTAVGAVSNASALLLEADASTRLYFKPAADFNGTVTDGITFRAWDESTGTAGTKVDTSTNGGSSAFSSATDTAAVTVNAANDAPVITAPNGGNPASILVAENTTFVADVNATDVDAGTTLVYSISGGADAAKFTINSSTGVLSFISAPNFEAPTDVGGNNVYDVIVRVSDGTLTDTQAISVTVTDANDPPVGVADHVYTNASSSGNGTTLVLQNSWLVKNDTDNEGNTLNVATASDGDDVDQVNAGATTTSIRVDVSSGNTGDFTYTATDGTSQSGSTTVTVHRTGDSITGSNGNDILIGAGSAAATLDGGAGSDFVTGGSGADILVADQNDYLLDGGGGIDTLRVSSSFTSTSDAQIVNIENVLLTTGTTVNLSNQTESFTITGSSGADSITGGSGNDTILGAQNDTLLAGGGGTDTLQVAANFDDTGNGQITGIENVTLTAAVTLNLGQQTEGFTITGSAGADTIIGGSGADTITGGMGADTLTGNGGADTFVVSSGQTTLTIGGFGNNGTISGYDRITDFNVAVDKLTLNGTPFAASNTSGVNGNNSDLTIGGNQVSSHAISNGIITFDDTPTFSSALTLDSTQDVAAVVDYLRQNDLGNAGATVAFTATIGGVNHTYIYEQVGSTPSSTNDILVDLQNVMLTSGGTSLATLIGNDHVDPVVLDLGTQGISFSSIGDGVQFDINGDGAKDQLAWTADGQDGILALDLDGSGKIESGNELFTPNFNGGHFADGIAALASLDGNHDGVINAKDQAFGDLVVWQDANHNGVSEGGELIKLGDLGIKSIDLATTPGSPIDGQTIAGVGSFTYADGTIGTFVEVDLDASRGASATADTAHLELPHGFDKILDFGPGHGELTFPPSEPTGEGQSSHFTFVEPPLTPDVHGDTSAAAAKVALAVIQAGGTVDAAHLIPGH